MNKGLILSILLIFAFLNQPAYCENEQNTQQHNHQREQRTPDYDNQDISEIIWQAESSQYIYDNYGSQNNSQYIGDPSSYNSNFGGDAFDAGY